MAHNIKPGVATGDQVQEIFNYAKEKGFALPAVNVIGSDTINGVLETAASLNAPVILQFSNGGAQFNAGKGLSNEGQKAAIHGAIAGAKHVHELAEAYGATVILHTDHCAKKLLPWIDGLLDAGEQFYKENGIPLFSSHMIDLSEESLEEQMGVGENEQIAEIDLPLFGKVKLKEVSLPILTIMIGFLDGFNPCAMWVLIFLISLLLGMNDRRRMWILGSVFILTSGFVYFLFMTAWLNFFIFLGLVNWIRIAIAALAVFVAIHYLRDFVKNKDGACQVDLGSNKQKIFARLKEVVYRKSLIWSLLGIVLLAFSVNLLELVCSAGLPAVYTKVLSMSDLNTAQYYFYLLIYIVLFMLDDMAVFAITMISMKRVALNTKYARYSHLIGGIVMLIIGLLMFFKPEWIMFG